MYDVVVKKVHVRYLISWWVSRCVRVAFGSWTTKPNQNSNSPGTTRRRRTRTTNAGTVRRDAGSEQQGRALNDKADAKRVVHTVAEPPNGTAGSTRRQSELPTPSTPTRNRFVPLCSATLLLLLRLGWLLFLYVSSSFGRPSCLVTLPQYTTVSPCP